MKLTSRLERNVAGVSQARPAPAPGPDLGGHQARRAGRRHDPHLFVLDIDRIRVDPNQVRKEHKAETDPEVIELAASIKADGILEPLNVRYLEDANIYQLVAGERRFTAARLAGLPEVPVKLLDVGPEQVRRLQLIENIHRKDLTAMELADGLNDLLADGATIDDLAGLVHKSDSYIHKALGIARNLSPEAKAEGKDLPMTHLYEISQVPVAEQAEVAQLVRDENVTLKELRRVLENRKPQGGAGRPRNTRAFRRVIAGPHGITITLAAPGATAPLRHLVEAVEAAHRQLVRELEEEMDEAASADAA